MYLGNQPYQMGFVSNTFSGNGVTVSFTMSIAPANTASVLVVVGSSLLHPSQYSVSGTTLTFGSAPANGTNNISVRFLGVPASGVVNTSYRTVTEITATASQTVFTVPSYAVGFVNVYKNGIRLASTAFTATSGTTIVLGTGATAGDIVAVESFYVSSVLNAIPATAGSVGNLNLADNQIAYTKLTPAARGAGIGQVWQNVLSSRLINTTYYNTTGQTIMVAIGSANSSINVAVDGLTITQAQAANGNTQIGYTFLVPNGSSYSVTSSALNFWTELR